MAEAMAPREIELRVFEVDAARVRDELRTLGARALGTMNFKRAVLDVNPVNPDKWIRLRTEGETTTLAVKQRISQAADGTGEVEVVVGDFDATLTVLDAIGGYAPRSIQESRREAYALGGAEVTIDSWPQIPDFMEIEAPDEPTLRAVAAQLNVADRLTGQSVEQYYLEKLGIDIKTTSLRFE